ncbi:hypothetical protein CRUP_024720 [Coryphaenoides rupestris]|nr:hypothetical protein CRUP_024720 [Coryphaenoides rupestris]
MACVSAREPTGASRAARELGDAIDYYLRAMMSLASRGSHPAVWDSVNWELSTTYFTLATLLQDYAPLSRKAQEQIEREVTEAMMKLLRYCDLQTESARQPLYQYRAATIHHRLASMYHSCFRNQVRVSETFEQLYSKAVRLFLGLRDAPCDRHPPRLPAQHLEMEEESQRERASSGENSPRLRSLARAQWVWAQILIRRPVLHSSSATLGRSPTARKSYPPLRTKTGGGVGGKRRRRRRRRKEEEKEEEEEEEEEGGDGRAGDGAGEGVETDEEDPVMEAESLSFSREASIDPEEEAEEQTEEYLLRLEDPAVQPAPPNPVSGITGLTGLRIRNRRTT